MLFSFLFFTLFNSCQKEEISQSKLNISGKTASDYDKDIDEFSQIVAKSMKDSDFRIFLKNEAIKQFDGDYDILLAAGFDRNIGVQSSEKSTTLYSYLTDVATETKLKSTSSSTSTFLDSLIIKYPLLQISIPETFNTNAENWDAVKDELIVAFLPSDYNEQTTEYLKAYDSKGNQTLISAKDDPAKPVVVISLNERLEATSNFLKSAATNTYFSNNHYTYSFNTCVNTVAHSSETVELKSASANYDRDLKTGSDILWQGRFVSKEAFRQVEGWPSGRPEFRVIIAYIDKSSGTPTASSITKYIDKDGWVSRYVFYTDIRTKTINIPIMRWYIDRYGSDMKYHWIEIDPGGSALDISTSVSTKFTDGTTYSSSFKTTITDDDDDSGEALVQYEHNTDGDGTEYNTGIIRFWIKQ